VNTTPEHLRTQGKRFRQLAARHTTGGADADHYLVGLADEFEWRASDLERTTASFAEATP
jgi:hypothetical protein